MEKIIDGLKIEYNMRGSGDIIFLLHGWGSKKELFEPIISCLSAKYTCISFDFPGFGGSDEPPEVWDVDRFTDFTVKFINSFSCESVVLLGHSFGGRVILKMAVRDNLPFSINRIILVDSAGIMPKRDISYKIKVASYKISKKAFSLPLMKKLFPNAIENSRKKKGSADYAAASPIMRGCLVKAVNEDLRDLLPNIKIETLLVWGTLDDATPLEDALLMEKLLPDAGLAKIEGAGHFSWLDSPAVFNAIISSYMNL